ncbi:hypothetical protein RYD26_09945 [Pasteurellaceae bacterium LIM206]|nr:hypothetical protein [Pasteurellaceae bacterium LIM206]
MLIRISIFFIMLGALLIPRANVYGEITVSDVRILQSENLEMSAIFAYIHNTSGEIVQLSLQENEFVKAIPSLNPKKRANRRVTTSESLVSHSLQSQDESLRIILFQPKKKLTADESLPLTFNVNDDNQIRVQAKVISELDLD